MDLHLDDMSPVWKMLSLLAESGLIAPGAPDPYNRKSETAIRAAATRPARVATVSRGQTSARPRTSDVTSH
jgi:hypothetical protein